MKINFSRWDGESLSYFVEIPEGWGGYQFLTNMENPGRWSEIPSVVGYGYFLEPHIVMYLSLCHVSDPGIYNVFPVL